MAEPHTIRLADLRAKPALTAANLEPGDTYTVGEAGKFNVTRVFSEPGGINLGLVITDEILKNDPKLVEMGVEVGDRYLEDEKKIIKTGSGSKWQQFWYGFDEEPNLTQNISDILESWVGLGGLGGLHFS